MSRVRLKLTFLFLGGGTAESSGGLADTVYIEIESLVELGLVLHRSITRSVMAPHCTSCRDTNLVR